jgi:polyisoprenoid-binding protein YceI
VPHAARTDTGKSLRVTKGSRARRASPVLGFSPTRMGRADREARLHGPDLARRIAALGIASLCAVGAALAEPVAYTLDPDRSSVAYETDFGPDLITGEMPVTGADLVLDFDRVANSTVAVSLSAARATASFPFAAQALRGPKVLDTDRFPDLTFRSTRIRAAGDGDGARVDGDITIRGVTRPLTLDAVIWRQQGTEAGDRSRLTLRLTGRLKRSDFGATGWSDMVGDEVRLIITARVTRAGG